MIEKSGLEIVEELYPFPDFRFTTTIFSKEYMPKAGDYETSRYSYSNNSYRLFDESVLASILTEENCFSDYANSFLFILK